MFNHLIRMYIAVLDCVLLISVYSVCLLSRFEPCGTKPDHATPSHCLSEWWLIKNYTAHAQSIFQFNVCGKKIMTIGALSCHHHHTSSHIIQSWLAVSTCAAKSMVGEEETRELQCRVLKPGSKLRMASLDKKAMRFLHRILENSSK